MLRDEKTVKQFVHETIKKYGMVGKGDRIVCGVSGGADSVAMLRVLLELKDEMKFEICAAHLNHMLRGDEARRDADFVRELCRKLGVEFFCRETDVAAMAEKSGESFELVARNARYAFFDDVLKIFGGNKIATAHNAEDNLETVLMHLARGSSLNGLGGIPPVRGSIIRPLLGCTRKRIKNYLSELNQEYVDDSTNAERIYTRNRVRLDVLPILHEINPKAAESVVNNSRMLREDEDYISYEARRIVDEFAKENGNISVSVDFLKTLHPALLRRVILQVAREVNKFTNYYLEFNHICDIINLVHSESPSAKTYMPGGLVVSRRYENLLFFIDGNLEKLECVKLMPGQTVRNGGYEIFCSNKKCSGCSGNGKTSFAISVCEENSEVIIRPRAPGDRIKLIGRPEKTLKKLFIDMKIPKDERNNIPVVVSDGKVVGVYGIGADERMSASDKEKILWVEIRRM